MRPGNLRVIVGTTDRNSDWGRRFYLNRVVSHPLFTGTSVVNDLALLRTNQMMPTILETPYINPICLPRDFSDYRGGATLVGFMKSYQRQLVHLIMFLCWLIVMKNIFQTENFLGSFEDLAQVLWVISIVGGSMGAFSDTDPCSALVTPDGVGIATNEIRADQWPGESSTGGDWWASFPMDIDVHEDAIRRYICEFCIIWTGFITRLTEDMHEKINLRFVKAHLQRILLMSVTKLRSPYVSQVRIKEKKDKLCWKKTFLGFLTYFLGPSTYLVGISMSFVGLVGILSCFTLASRGDPTIGWGRFCRNELSTWVEFSRSPFWLRFILEQHQQTSTINLINSKPSKTAKRMIHNWLLLQLQLPGQFHRLLELSELENYLSHFNIE